MLKGFKDFILRSNVVDLAVAVIIGGAFGQVVNSLVVDVFTPLIGALIGAPDFSSLKLGSIAFQLLPTEPPEEVKLLREILEELKRRG